MLFYKTNPIESNTGFKYVLFEVTDSENKVIYDWGFADWKGKEWDSLPVPEGFSAKIAYWANTSNPDELIKDPSKIFRI